MSSFRSKIRRRMERYLELDTDGIRYAVMKTILKVREVTVDYLYDLLSKKFDITHKTVASMVGYIHSKLGIMHAHKQSYKTHIVYTLRDEYVDLVQAVLRRSVDASRQTAATATSAVAA
ncbi:MAG TPA: DUF2551 domain-containing protein [Methanosarcinales archaeon]|nr:DUF2551 domain-containing protein [Methanosarcinales archaeon]